MTDIQYAILISFFVGVLAGFAYENGKSKKEIKKWKELAVKYRNKNKELKGLKNG